MKSERSYFSIDAVLAPHSRGRRGRSWRGGGSRRLSFERLEDRSMLSGVALAVGTPAPADGRDRASVAALVQTSPPVVTDASISITSVGTAIGGIYKVGDTVTVAWNNSSTGDDNPGIIGVTVNFSQFGGGTAVAATETGAGFEYLGGQLHHRPRHGQHGKPDCFRHGHQQCGEHDNAVYDASERRQRRAPDQPGER